MRRSRRRARRGEGDAAEGCAGPWGLFRVPGLVVAGRALAVAAARDRALRPAGVDRAGQVREVILLPGLQLEGLGGRRLVEGVVQPAMPLGRDLRGVGIALVDHPAALAAAVIAVAVVA